jgi:hypothetical protein
MLLIPHGVQQFFSCETNLSVPLYRLRSEAYFLRENLQTTNYRKLSSARHFVLSPRWRLGRAKNRQTVSQGSKSSNDNWWHHPSDLSFVQEVPCGSGNWLWAVIDRIALKKGGIPRWGNQVTIHPCLRNGRTRRHDRRLPTREKNWKKGQWGHVWKAALRNPISRGDSTYYSPMDGCCWSWWLSKEVSERFSIISPALRCYSAKTGVGR